MTCSYHFISIVSCWEEKKQMWENDTMLHQLHASMLVHSLLVGWSWGCQKLWDYSNEVNISASRCLIHILSCWGCHMLPSEIAGSQNAVRKTTRWKRWNRETLCRAFCCFEEKRCKFARTEAFIFVPRRRGQCWMMVDVGPCKSAILTKEKTVATGGQNATRNLAACLISGLSHGSLNVPIEHHPTIIRWCPIFPKWDIYQPL